MTGTEDDSPIGETRAEDRPIPFDLSGDLADWYPVIFAGEDHMIFCNGSARVLRETLNPTVLFRLARRDSSRTLSI